MNYKIIDITTMSNSDPFPRKATLQFCEDESRVFYAFIFDGKDCLQLVTIDKDSTKVNSVMLCTESNNKKLKDLSVGSLLKFHL